MKKILIYLLLFVLFSTIVSAALTDDLVSYWTFDKANQTGNENADYQGNFTALNVSATPSPGKLNEAFHYTTNRMNLSAAATTFDTYTEGTISLWVNDTGTTGGYMFTINDYDDAADYFACYIHAGGGVECDLGSGGDWRPAGNINTTGDGNYHHIVILSDGSHNEIWVDGVNDTNIHWIGGSNDGTWFADNGAGVDTCSIGALFRSSAVYTDVAVDELGVWNRALTASEISDLNAGGLGCAPPFIDCGVQSNTTVNITLYDDFSNSSITNFTLNITWNNGTTELETSTTGNVYKNIGTHNSSLIANLTFYNITNYFNSTYPDQTITANVSNTITTYAYQAIACFNASEYITGTGIIPDNITISGTVRTSCFNLTAASHNVMAQENNYYSQNHTFTITALTNATYTIPDMTSSLVNITAYYSNGTLLPTFGINITTTLNSTFSSLLTTTNGTVWFNLVNGTFTAAINSTEGNETFNFTVDALTEHIAYYYFDIDNCSTYTNTILNFTMLRESDNALLNNATLNIWVNATSPFIGTYKSFNFSFTSVNYYALCVPDNTITSWTINAQAEYSLLPTYAEKNYWFVNYPLNSSPTNINLYLTNNTAQVTLQVRDYNDDAISDAYISVLSYDLGTNSYRTTEIVKTDSGGDAYAQIVQNTNWYAFIVEYEGEILLQTLPTKITTNTLTLRVNLDTDYFASYDVTQGITYDLTFNNNTATYSFTWSDPTGGVAQGCIRLTKQSINGETVLNTSCTTSSAATLLITIPEAVGTNTYRADAYVTISGQNFPLDTLSHSYNTTYRTFGLSGIFLSMLVILTLVMVGLWHPAAAVILMVVGVVTTNVMGIFYLNWTYIITFIILAAITIYRTGRSE